MKGVLVVLSLTLFVAFAFAQTPSKPTFGAYSAVFKHEDDKSGFTAKVYYDPSDKGKFRFDDIEEESTELNLNLNSDHYVFNDTTCNTYCMNFTQCPRKTPCNDTYVDIFSHVAASSYTGSCTGGNLWTTTFANDTTIAYCIADNGEPLQFTIAGSGISKPITIDVSKYVSGTSDPDSFDVPWLCLCLNDPGIEEEDDFELFERDILEFDLSNLYFLRKVL